MAEWQRTDESEPDFIGFRKASHVEEIARHFTVSVGLIGALFFALAHSQWAVAILFAALLLIWGASLYFHEFEILHFFKAKRHPSGDESIAVPNQPTLSSTARPRRRANCEVRCKNR